MGAGGYGPLPALSLVIGSNVGVSAVFGVYVLGIWPIEKVYTWLNIDIYTVFVKLLALFWVTVIHFSYNITSLFRFS